MSFSSDEFVEALSRRRHQRIPAELTRRLVVHLRRLVDAVPLDRREPHVQVDARGLGAGGAARVWPQSTNSTPSSSRWYVGLMRGGRSASWRSTSRRSGWRMVT